MAELSEQVALQRFSCAPVAVLGTVTGAGAPHLVPVTFAMLDDCVVFAVDHKPKSTTRLRRVRNIEQNAAVSFLADHYDDDWRRLWWVRLDAQAAIVQDRQQDDRYEPAVDALVEKYPQYRQLRPGGVVVVATITGVSGWAFTADQAVQ